MTKSVKNLSSALDLLESGRAETARSENFAAGQFLRYYGVFYDGELGEASREEVMEAYGHLKGWTVNLSDTITTKDWRACLGKFDRVIIDTEVSEDELKDVKGVIVKCYYRYEIWKSRSKAKRFYLEAMNACDGSERDRYTNIYCDLMSRKKICRDE